MIALTFDIDWAPDAIIADTLDLLTQHGAAATLFATHATPVLDGLPRERLEIGIHPNFNPLLDGGGGSADRVLDDLLALFPDARGVRSHSMTQSSVLLRKFAERGLAYDANHLLPYQRVEPFRLWTGMTRIPYNWEDDLHWAYGRSFASSGLDLDAWPLCVFDFHPIHVFLNTECAARYERARPHYRDVDALRALRNRTDVPGARTLLCALLQRLTTDGTTGWTLSDIARRFVAGNGAGTVLATDV